MMMLLLINLLIVLMVSAYLSFLTITYNPVSKALSNLVTCSTLGIMVYGLYLFGWTLNLIFAGIGTMLTTTFFLLQTLIYCFGNKRVKLPVISAIYPNQSIDLKSAIFKIRLIEFLEKFFYFIGTISLVSFIGVIIFSAITPLSTAMAELAHQQIPITTDNVNKTLLLTIAGVASVVSGILWIILKNLRKKLKPQFWRAQLRIQFNRSNLESVVEITDQKIISDIFSYNKFYLIRYEKDDGIVEQNTINYIQNRYGLKIQQILFNGAYAVATTIGVESSIDGYKFYFIKSKKSPEQPPSSPKESSQETINKENHTKGVAVNAI